MPIVRQLGSFGLVGVGATIMHLAVAYALMEHSAVDPYLGNAVGAFCAFWVSFLGNAKVTFRYGGAITSALTKYASLSAVSLVLTSAILFLTETSSLSRYAYVVGALITVPPITFLLSKFWVFRSTS